MPATARRLLPVSWGCSLFGFALHVLRAELHARQLARSLADIRELPSIPAPARGAADVRSTTPSSPATTSSPSPTSASGCPPASTSRSASFLSYAISNNVGFAMLSGASVRYRFYSALGSERRGALAASSSRTR